MDKKGELAFSTIVVVIIALVLLVSILVWFVPMFSQGTQDVEDVKDAAGVNRLDIMRLRCNRLCSDAESAMRINKNIGADELDFCNDDECLDLLSASRISCTVDC
jgi:hypothetical protein